MCVELDSPQIATHDLVRLQEALPKNLRGISFEPPEVLASSEFQIKSERRESQVSQYMIKTAEKLLVEHQPLAALHFLDLAKRVQHSPSLALLRAQTLVRLGRIDEAQSEITHFLKHSPSHSTVSLLQGRIAMSRNDYEGAHRHFLSAMALSPQPSSDRGVAQVFLAFNQIFRDRDGLYALSLNPQRLTQSIQQLLQRVRNFRSQIQASALPEIQGMQPHLDALERLFESWLHEMAVSV